MKELSTTAIISWSFLGIVLLVGVILLVKHFTSGGSRGLGWPSWLGWKLLVAIAVTIVSYLALEGIEIPVLPNWATAILCGITIGSLLQWPGKTIGTLVLLAVVYFFLSGTSVLGTLAGGNESGTRKLVFIDEYKITPGADAVSTAFVDYEFEIFTNNRRVVEIKYPGTNIFVPYNADFDGDIAPTLPDGAHKGKLKIKAGKDEKESFSVKLYKVTYD
jgi:hypothetical protein